MALLFQYDLGLVVKKKEAYVLDAKTVARLRETLKAKKIPQSQIDDFVKEIKKYPGFSSLAQAASDYFFDNAAGVKELFVKKPNLAQGLATAAVLGPQRAYLLRKFDLGVHLKGSNLVMQHTDAKGATKDLFVTKP